MKNFQQLAIVFLTVLTLFACEETETINRNQLYPKFSPMPKNTSTSQPDSDGDGVADADDNCPYVHNPRQEDFNENGIGDVCEEEIYEIELYGATTSLRLSSRPRPCPKPSRYLRGGKDPVEHCSPKLDVFIPEFRFEIVYIRGEIINEAGETYACTTEECDGNVLIKPDSGEVWLSFGVVEPGLSEEPLQMMVTLGYYKEGALIYDEFLGEIDPRMLEAL